MESGIYKIISPNGKIYIGQSINLKIRLKKYKNKDCKTQSKLFNSIIKYGIKSHIFEIIEYCEIQYLNEKERYWQDFYNCVIKGLNCRLTKTNDKTGTISEETKRKLSIFNKGKKLSKETIEKIKVTKKLNNIKGYKLNLTQKQLEIKSNKLKKKVLQFSLKGVFIKEWDSGLDASKVIKVQRTHIYACCRNKRGTAGGYIWKYKVLP